jgi:hypothetical protein
MQKVGILNSSDEHEGFFHQFLHPFFIDFDSLGTVDIKGMDSLAQKFYRFDEAVCHNRCVYIEFEPSLGGSHGNDGLVAMHPAGHHGQGFTLGGVYLARHDGRARFVGRNGQFSQSCPWAAGQKTDIIGKFHAVPAQSVQGAMSENHVVSSGQRIELIGSRGKGNARFFRNGLRHLFAEVLGAVEASAYGSAADGQLVKVLFSVLNHGFGFLQHFHPARHFLSKGEGHRILHMGAADFYGVHVFPALCLKGSNESVQRPIQVLMEGIYSRHMKGCGECIVGGLGHIYIIIGVNSKGAAYLFQFGIGNMGHHFVHIHVALGAGAGLVHHQREFSVPLAFQDFIAGTLNGFSLFRSQGPSFLVHLSGAFFQDSKGADNFFRHHMADFEIFKRALGLGAPHVVCRNTDFA